ncbi:methyl-accepting chemotaxis protein [Roseomonas sp. WA12]
MPRSGPKATLSIRGKLLAAFGPMFLLFLVLGGLSVLQLRLMNGATREIRDNWMPAMVTIAEMKLLVSRERTNAARIMATEDPAQRVGVLADLARWQKEVENTSRTYSGMIRSPEERALFEAYQAAYRAYGEFTAPLLQSGATPAAIAQFNGESVRRFRAVVEALDRSGVHAKEGAGDAGERSEAIYDRAIWIVLGTVLLAAILSAVSVAWLARSVGGGIRGLSATMLRLSRRDYGFDLPEAARRDEIGEMARAVGTCRDGLREADALTAARAEEEEAKAGRAARVDALLRDFEAEASEVLRGVAAASVQLDATAGEMAGTAQDGVARATSVAAASEQASANVQTVAASAEELAASIAEVSRQVNSSAEVARRAADDARATDGAVQGLSEAARSIGDVVRLINDIAGQTNLLALNATIEAARAGEAGRGFAVVASEVKTLAAQTAKATEEIGSQIAAMQGETERAVQAIGGIVRTIEEMNGITTQVAAAAEEQTAATREIGRAVAEAASGTQDVSRHTAGVTEGAERTGLAANQLRTASGELARQAETLRGRVDGFLSEIRAA